jgi:hypothetical protein
MPQSKLDREMDRSCRPWRTNDTTSLRALSGCTNVGCDAYRSSSRSAYRLSAKK